ncbi:hypothetical protein K469DRAFT_592348 [Zopfia rhizophila CBS 207.26]|uniref:Uncharacterized protein n=1 Tax=Zopfia rhizophila CBS 207.26 TaxID=1314779 RepID=A0A6A6DQX1_9PEZI|nr:hypothetical protein K469DRAFT_592348 [Zopfia rhizophila CBS 207.26]
MPFPVFQRSPRPNDSPASTSSSRFGALHNNVRSMINGSSVYSNSPVSSNNNTPKLPFLGFLRRPQSPPNPIVVPENEAPRDSSDSRSPLHPQHTAGSYQRVIAPLGSNPREPDRTYNRHPAEVPLGSVDPETAQLQEEVHGRRRRHHRRRRKHHRPTHWVRRRSERGICFSFIRSHAARGKCIACLISGLFLMTVLTIYLSLALTKKALGQEVHVLFIMIILGTTIFFCHSLIRLCMLALHPEEEGPRIPSMTGPEGFHPVRPIRVHLARDEEIGVEDDDEVNDPEKMKGPAPPPPAYGLWRSSVRVDPNLLHWQRVDDSSSATPADSHPNSRNGSVSGIAGPASAERPREEHTGLRPPSYVSDDGVTYVVEAAPRSVAPSHTGVSDIHPAWRPGFAMSEVHIEDWPAPRRV